VGVAHVAPDGRWLRVNQRLCEITGYEPEELLERSFADITHPDDVEQDRAQLARMVAGDERTHSREKRYIRKDGTPVWVDRTVSLTRTPTGEPDYFISIVEDISARKAAEARLRTALAVKDEFLGLVSHELRTPMTVILGMSDLLAGGRLDPADARAVAADIADSAADLNDLIESMLLLARLDQDEEQADEPLLVDRVAAKAVVRQRQRDPSREYRLESRGDVLVEAHPGLIERIVANLLSNASKYSAEGSSVQVHIEADGSEVRVHVLDDGPGVPDEEMERLFEPFYRATASVRAPGAGLGLSVVRRIAESFGGRAWAANRAGGGSDFGFALPQVRIPED
jgi:PAS domain S-box-containing protein